MTRTALYRHLDQFGRLLYVGISLSAFQRTRQHGQHAAWFEDVTRIDIEWFGARLKAEAAEWQAIKNEKPIHNKQFNRRSIDPADRAVLVVGDTFITKARLRQIAGQV